MTQILKQRLFIVIKTLILFLAAIKESIKELFPNTGIATIKAIQKENEIKVRITGFNREIICTKKQGVEDNNEEKS